MLPVPGVGSAWCWQCLVLGAAGKLPALPLAQQFGPYSAHQNAWRGAVIGSKPLSPERHAPAPSLTGQPNRRLREGTERLFAAHPEVWSLPPGLNNFVKTNELSELGQASCPSCENVWSQTTSLAFTADWQVLRGEPTSALQLTTRGWPGPAHLCLQGSG